MVVAGIHWVCRESKGLINVADKLGRSPLLAGLMAGAGLAAVTELLKQGDGSRASNEGYMLYDGSRIFHNHNPS